MFFKIFLDFSFLIKMLYIKEERSILTDNFVKSVNKSKSLLNSIFGGKIKEVL